MNDIINLTATLTPAGKAETITHRDNAPRSTDDEREPLAALMDDTPIKAGTGHSLMKLRCSNETQPRLGRESMRLLSDALTGHDNVTKSNDLSLIHI